MASPLGKLEGGPVSDPLCQELDPFTKPHVVPYLIMNEPFNESIRFSKWNFSNSCLDLLTDVESRRKHFQIQSPNRIIPLTPEIVMLMLLIRGCLHKGNTDYLAAVLAKAFSLTEKNLEQALAEKFTNSSNATELSSSIISPRLEEVFDFAENISRRVSAKARISQRHLIAALLYRDNNSQISKSGMELPTSIFRLNEFAWELEKYVKSSPTVRSKELAQEWELVIAEIRHGIPPVNPQKPSLADTEDDLQRQIGELAQRRATAKNKEERDQIASEIENKKFQLEIVLGEKDGPSPKLGIPLPAGAKQLASEVRALEEKGVNTTDQAERVQINAELDAVLGQNGSKVPSNSETPIEPTKIQIGGRLHMTKTATAEEKVLGVDNYAKVLAKLFRSSDNKDLCLAIFGAWGRGKTFLTEQTLEELEKGNVAGAAHYKPVKFSAWKYPSRPEVWIYLFQSFFESLRKPGFLGWFKSFAYVIRFGILRNGILPLVGAWFALIVTAVPKLAAVKAVFHYFWQMEAVIAVAAIIFLALFLSKFWKTALILKRHFFSTADHAEKLGLQATIGKDLKALLEAWVQVDNRSRATQRGIAWFSWAIAALCWVIAWRAWHTPEIVMILNAALLLPVLFIIIAFYASSKSPQRLLLVVDDLDRCQLDHLLSIVESIKLLLEESEINKRVQVLMLMEEEVLKHAIWEKYSKLVSPHAKAQLGTKYDGNRLVRENFDKLFTAHLRLCGLRFEDIHQVIQKFGGQPVKSDVTTRKVEEDSKERSQLPTKDVDKKKEQDSNPKGRTENIGEKAEDPGLFIPAPRKYPREKNTEYSVTPKEKESIQQMLRKVYRDRPHDLGPRAIRTFMFRYQLARMILEEIGNDSWTPSMLANMIATRTLIGEIKDKDLDDEEDEVKRVVEQVA
jgi:signal transduction histidine kinase